MYTKPGRPDREPVAAAGASGVEGNERPTALTGTVLLAGLVIALLTVHLAGNWQPS